MSLKIVGRKTGGYSETTDTSSEGSRLPCRERIHLYPHGRGGHPLADCPVLILEETVEDAVGCAPTDPDIDQADQFGRVDRDGSRLLGNKDIRPQHSGVVDLVVKTLAFELNVGRRIGLLTPETIESRELRVLEASDIHSLVELQGSRQRLTYHHL